MRHRKIPRRIVFEARDNFGRLIRVRRCFVGEYKTMRVDGLVLSYRFAPGSLTFRVSINGLLVDSYTKRQRAVARARQIIRESEV